MFPTDHDFRRYAIAQATAKRIATQIAQQIEPGMTEADAYSLAEQSFQREGIRRHWHMPVIGPRAARVNNILPYVWKCTYVRAAK